MLSSVAVDVAPLRASRDFRLLFIGQGVSIAGGMITYVAIPFQVFALTHSSLAVGLLSLTEFVPIAAVAFLGGALADAVDRRRMVLLTEAGLAVVSTALVVNAAVGRPQLAVLFVAAACTAALDGLQRPSLDAMVPRLVVREQIQAAAALESMRGTFGRVLGPAIGGGLIALVGLPLTYGVDVATFAVSTVALLMMNAVPPRDPEARINVRAVVDGLRYARRRQDLLGTYLVDMSAMFFGMPQALFPQIAAQLGGPAVLGVLYAAPSAGALLTSSTSGWIKHVHRHGRAIAIAAAVWGAAIIGFGFAPVLWVALLALAIAGAADMVSGLFRLTIWNRTIPDAMRGRLASIELLSYTSGPSLGNFEAGVVAALAGVRTSIVSGGVLCVAATVALSAALPRFWRYRSGDADV